MEIDSLNQDGPPESLIGMGSAAVEWVRARARELSLLAGRPLGHVTPIDFEQAKRELQENPRDKNRKAASDR